MSRPTKKVLDSFLFDNATKFKFETTDLKIGFVTIESRSLNNEMWAICNNGDVWSKSEQAFINELSPSNRTAEFIKNTRFFSVYDALDVVMRMIK